MSETRGSKRGRIEIYGDILRAIEDDMKNDGGARLTRIQGTVNMPYDRFRSFIDALVKLQMVSLKKKETYYEIKLEQKGSEYLRHYEAVQGFLEAFVLDGKNRPTN